MSTFEERKARNTLRNEYLAKTEHRNVQAAFILLVRDLMRGDLAALAGAEKNALAVGTGFSFESAILAANEVFGFPPGDLVKLREVMAAEISDDELRAAAVERHVVGSDNEVEIDENAIVSRSEHGAFVAAWVWVDYPSEGS